MSLEHTQESLRCVAKKLSAEYVFGGAKDGVVSVGVGAEHVFIYLLDENSGHSIPEQIDGVRIERIVTGMPKLCADDSDFVGEIS